MEISNHKKTRRNLKSQTSKKQKKNKNMKTKISLFLLIIASISMFGLSSCRKKINGCADPLAYNFNPSATKDNGSCKYEGDVMFYYNSSLNVGTITINGQTGTINSYFPGAAPDCGTTGCANFRLPEGKYNYVYKVGLFGTYNWTVDVYPNQCNKILIQ